MAAPTASTPPLARPTRRIAGLLEWPQQVTARGAALARGRRARLDARRHGRDALLPGARAPHARPRDGQGATGGLLNSLTLLASAIGGLRLRLPGRPRRPHARADGSRSSCTRWPAAPAASPTPIVQLGDLPLHPGPRDGRGVDDGRRAHRRDLAAPSTAARRSASCSPPGPSARSSRPAWSRSCCPRFGWRAVFFVGVLPALIVFWIRRDVPESEIWLRRRAAPERLPARSRVLWRKDLRRNGLRGDGHERLRHVRLLGPLHLDPGLPLAARRRGRPRPRPHEDHDLADRRWGSGSGWLRALRLLRGRGRTAAQLRRLPARRRRPRAALRRGARAGVAAGPRSVRRVLRDRLLLGLQRARRPSCSRPRSARPPWA